MTCKSNTEAIQGVVDSAGVIQKKRMLRMNEADRGRVMEMAKRVRSVANLEWP